MEQPTHNKSLMARKSEGDEDAFPT